MEVHESPTPRPTTLTTTRLHTYAYLSRQGPRRATATSCLGCIDDRSGKNDACSVRAAITRTQHGVCCEMPTMLWPLDACLPCSSWLDVKGVAVPTRSTWLCAHLECINMSISATPMDTFNHIFTKASRPSIQQTSPIVSPTTFHLKSISHDGYLAPSIQTS
jgi:hypothetical protein